MLHDLFQDKFNKIAAIINIRKAESHHPNPPPKKKKNQKQKQKTKKPAQEGRNKG